MENIIDNNLKMLYNMLFNLIFISAIFNFMDT